MKKVMKTMKAWLLRWLSSKVAETAKANGNDSHNINNVDKVEKEPGNTPDAKICEMTTGCAEGDGTREAQENRNNVDNLHTRLLAFLMRRYELRYNILTEQAEYRMCDACDGSANGQKTDWRVIDKRAQNTLVMEARAEGINGWDVDMGRLVNSHLVPDFHPMLSYMQNLPVWDGRDRVTPLAHRISTDPLWVHGFTTWLRALAAQWEGRTMQTANMLAPILISRQQGRRKSTFCRLLVPDALQPYYLDRFDPNSKANAEQRLAGTALINMDEFDRYPASVMPSLKNYMQMNASNFRKMRTNRYLNLPRVASFIGTSNRKDLLTDPTGSRRFLCWEVERNIDCTPIEHDQLFAQLRQQLDEGQPTYLTSEWEREVEAHNEAYQRVSPEQDAFLQTFRLPEGDEEPTAYSATQIFALLCKAYPQVMRGITAHALSRSLTALGILPRHTRKGNVYHLIPITTS